MKVILRNPKREVQVAGGRRVKDVLRELDIVPETVLVIRGDTLVTADQMVTDDDTIELRPVMSGGRAQPQPVAGEASGEMIGDGRAQPQPVAGEASDEMFGDAR